MWRRLRKCILTSLLPCENRGERSWVSLPVSATCDPSVSRRSPRMLLASNAEVLWRGPEVAMLADAMIEIICRHNLYPQGAGIRPDILRAREQHRCEGDHRSSAPLVVP